MTVDGIESKIRSILLGCPLAPEKKHSIEYHVKLLAAVAQLVGKGGYPRFVKTQAAAEKYLHTLGTAAFKLAKHLNSMPFEVRSALALDSSEILQLTDLLGDIIHRIVGLKRIPEPTGKSGPQENLDAITVALIAARTWHVLTLRKPTPGTKDRSTEERSDFEKFLGEIFRTLKINASAEHYAKRAEKDLKEWRKRLQGRPLLLSGMSVEKRRASRERLPAK
jgi:hypothetical protein